MKKELIEYHPNGQISHRIVYRPNGNKEYEQYFDQQGCDHRDSGLPDYQRWYPNEISNIKTYYVHGKNRNIYNPSYIRFFDIGKIGLKEYRLSYFNYSKLNWMNLIKNI